MNTEESIKEIVEQLTAIRAANGLSQGEVARKMGLSGVNPQAALSKWERGQKIPTDDNLALWAQALGMELRVTRTLLPAEDISRYEKAR